MFRAFTFVVLISVTILAQPSTDRPLLIGRVPTFIDGGSIRLPNRAAYDPSGTTWGIENIGVAPDFDVEIAPADVIAGRDPQLEKAIEVALAEISKNPQIAPKRPPFPVHPGGQKQVSSLTPRPE